MKKLKLIDERAVYTTLAEYERYKQPEAEPDIDLPLEVALEIARLQTELADLRECNLELRQKLKRKHAWAKIWRRAAQFWRKSTKDFLKRPKNQIKESSPSEPCPTCGHFVPDGKAD